MSKGVFMARNDEPERRDKRRDEKRREKRKIRVIGP